MLNKENSFEFIVNNQNYIFVNNPGIIFNKSENLKTKSNEDSNSIDRVLSNAINLDKNYQFAKYVKTLTFFITNRCNLNCVYCYNIANNIDDYNEMKLSTFKNVIRYFLKNFRYKDFINIEYFGGEPLLNFKFIKESLIFLNKIEKQKKIKFNKLITTNGTILNEEIKEILVRNNFRILISIDGNEYIHDKNRKFKNGSGTFNIILNNVKELSKYLKLGARITINDFNIKLSEVCKFLINSGFSYIQFDIASINESSTNFNNVIKNKLSIMIDELTNYFHDELINRKFINITNITKILKAIADGITKTSKLFPCKANIIKYSISCKGDFFLCHRFNNIKEFQFGCIKSGFDFDKRNKFLAGHQIHKRNVKCSKCWAKYLCGGDCYNTAYFKTKSTKKASTLHCFFDKKIIENCLKIFISLENKKKILNDNLNKKSSYE